MISQAPKIHKPIILLCSALLTSITCFGLSKAPFPKKTVVKIKSLNFCRYANDCKMTGYNWDDYSCLALCESGEIYINKNKSEEFESIRSSLMKVNNPLLQTDKSGQLVYQGCLMGKCGPKAYYQRLLACIHKKCVLK
jgi:hypothetical protein